jgi:hypothetical protein
LLRLTALASADDGDIHVTVEGGRDNGSSDEPGASEHEKFHRLSVA